MELLERILSFIEMCKRMREVEIDKPLSMYVRELAVCAVDCSLKTATPLGNSHPVGDSALTLVIYTSKLLFWISEVVITVQAMVHGVRMCMLLRDSVVHLDCNCELKADSEVSDGYILWRFLNPNFHKPTIRHMLIFVIYELIFVIYGPTEILPKTRIYYQWMFTFPSVVWIPPKCCRKQSLLTPKRRRHGRAVVHECIPLHPVVNGSTATR